MHSDDQSHNNVSNGSSSTSSITSSSSSCHIKKKRVGKACDSCRIKKTKCDGKKPCNRCLIDNKICVFTEKKKMKEKTHPQGYIELLETRLDILSKSFEKLIELSRPYLPVIDNIIKDQQIPFEDDEDSSGEDEVKNYDVIPINKVVGYLIDEKGLLNNLPVEWEEGAIIASRYNNKNKSNSSKLFANHKIENLNNNNISTNLKLDFSNSSSNSTKVKKIKEESISPIDQSSFLNNFNSVPFNNLQRSNSGIYPSNSNEIISSDAESDTSNRNPDSISPPFILESQDSHQFHGSLGHVPTAVSLFSNNGGTSISKNSSMTSLSNRYENYSISNQQQPPNSTNTTNSPPLSTFTYSPKSLSAIRRSSSTSLSHGQLKALKNLNNNHNDHHIHKPPHISHNRINSMEFKKRHNSNEELLSLNNNDNNNNTSLAGPMNEVSTTTTTTDFNVLNQFENDDQSILLNNGPINQYSMENYNNNEELKSNLNNEFPLNNTNSNFDVLVGGYDPFINNGSFMERF
ncbi:FCR1 [Candida pseudojiufengensis]|uniref:FCR1 n=1 Tax=Candida pseudojiufengensis TaxID=497109 RepID=UPI002224F090|nr:FCR1 [Candida pseudojiufengensis]KAI5959156.1 FCR1 [Candida pseudojiufengensis]